MICLVLIGNGYKKIGDVPTHNRYIFLDKYNTHIGWQHGVIMKVHQPPTIISAGGCHAEYISRPK